MDRNIPKKFRKPRKTKGTPFYFQRNIWALGVVVFGVGTVLLFEWLPSTKKLRQELNDGKFKNPEGLETRKLHIQLSRQDLILQHLLTKTREKE